MSERDRRPRGDDEDVEPRPRDPEASSTWNTIGGAIDVDDITNEEELEDLMVEPTGGELGILADTDVPGRPG
jgi:hypothetical protein